MLTETLLRRLFANGRAELIAALVAGERELAEAGIASKLRMAHFLAQVATETGGLKSISESLNYSVDGLLKTFGRHRISEADCRRYGRTSTRRADQERIANLVYGGEWGRKNLGNTEAGDGWRYRGGGMLQTTGRANYRGAGHEGDPEALRAPATALRAALHFWSTHGINALADRDDVTAVRKAINGGTNGLNEAKGWLDRAKAVLA